ncbi:MAG: hypothetical protein ABID40_01275, partial [Candidatus Bipolaricaulota bacterium]
IEVVRRTPKIRHWLPTKEYGQVRAFLRDGSLPTNLTVCLAEYRVGTDLDMGLLKPFFGVPNITFCTVTPATPGIPDKRTKYLPSFKAIPSHMRYRVTDPKLAFIPLYIRMKREEQARVNAIPSSAPGAGNIYSCPAWSHVGTCGPCRACWNPKVLHVSYPWH